MSLQKKSLQRMWAALAFSRVESNRIKTLMVSLGNDTPDTVHRLIMFIMETIHSVSILCRIWKIKYGAEQPILLICRVKIARRYLRRIIFMPCWTQWSQFSLNWLWRGPNRWFALTVNYEDANCQVLASVAWVGRAPPCQADVEVRTPACSIFKPPWSIPVAFYVHRIAWISHSFKARLASDLPNKLCNELTMHLTTQDSNWSKI